MKMNLNISVMLVTILNIGLLILIGYVSFLGIKALRKYLKDDKKNK